jgi:hypothetical protein
VTSLGFQTFRRTEGFDTSGIEFVGAYGEPNAEAIAALEPDLIVGYEFDSDYADQFDATRARLRWRRSHRVATTLPCRSSSTPRA